METDKISVPFRLSVTSYDRQVTPIMNLLNVA